MIAVLGWCDGFGYDTTVLGIFDDIKTACKICGSTYNDMETRYIEVKLNEIQEFDYYEGHKLCNNSKKKKRGK